MPCFLSHVLVDFYLHERNIFAQRQNNAMTHAVAALHHNIDEGVVMPFLMRLLPFVAHHMEVRRDNHMHENRTIDVTTKACGSGNFDTMACLRCASVHNSCLKRTLTPSGHRSSLFSAPSQP